jgi:2-keto-4-pentenoate hydratase/2-oxohepta-3-ene-1,7-dioic acid hydratase in catechol pathway
MKRIRARYQDSIIWADVMRTIGTDDNDTVLHLCDMMGNRTGDTLTLGEVTLLTPCDPRIIVCVGKNYAKHIQEMGGDDLPKEPGLFLKALNTLTEDSAPISYPSWTDKLHYEGELAVVIGKTLSKVTEAEALDYVLGYTCAIDVTARDKQRSDLQWTRGKSADGFCPVGPWLETDLDPTNVNVQTHINDELRQDGNTQDMIFSVANVLSYISQFMTLNPGDLVLTGTPEGVGPLHVNDTICVTVEGIGTLERHVIAG